MSKETVSTAHTTWLDIQEIKVERFVAQKNCQGVNWANVFKCIVSPVHADREGQWSKHFWNASQDFFSWFSSFVLSDINVLFTFDFTEFNIINRQAFPTDESLCRFWEVSICIQGNFLRRSFKIFGQIRLLISQTNHTDCQTTWCWEGLNAFVWKTVVIQEGCHFLTELFFTWCDNVGWQLFKS